MTTAGRPDGTSQPRRGEYGLRFEDLDAEARQQFEDQRQQFEPPTTQEPPPAKRRRGGWLAAAFLTTAVIVGIKGYEAGLFPLDLQQASPLLSRTPATIDPQAAPEPAPGAGLQTLHGKNPDMPTPGKEVSREPLGTPAPLPAQSSAYAFLPLPGTTQNFVAYDPCRPVHYVMRETNAPEGGKDMILAGFNELSRVTGLKFIYDGATVEAPSESRRLYQPETYGDRWAPVLVAWSTPEESPKLARKETLDTLGYAGSAAATPDTNSRYVLVTGQVVLNTDALAETTAVEGPTLTPSVIAHELAHLVGLDHVDDPTQLMHPEASSQRPVYADGDLTGLSILGRGTCSPNL